MSEWSPVNYPDLYLGHYGVDMIDLTTTGDDSQASDFIRSARPGETLDNWSLNDAYTI